MAEFLDCGCKKFSDGGVIMCPTHLFEYNALRAKVGKVFGQHSIPAKEDNASEDSEVP